MNRMVTKSASILDYSEGFFCHFLNYMEIKNAIENTLSIFSDGSKRQNSKFVDMALLLKLMFTLTSEMF